MNSLEILSIVTIPVSLFIAIFGVFVGIAFATKKNRTEAIRIIQQMDFGKGYLVGLLTLWAEQFYYIFGRSYWAKRQLITVPLYTLTISGIFFLIWIAYLYIFENPKHLIVVDFPVAYKLAVKDYYYKGIFASIFLDFIVIFLTKFLLKVGTKVNFISIKFILLFFIGIIFSLFLFSNIVFIFRVADMVMLYSELAPYDTLPILPYDPISYLFSSLKLFTPETIIHVTSAGWYTTYFMPEPLLFYCAITTYAIIFLIFLISLLSLMLSKLKVFSLFLSGNIGSPKTNAFVIVIFSILIFLSIPVVLFACLSLLP